MTAHNTQRWVEDKLLDDRNPFPPEAVAGDITLKVRNPAHWQVLRSPYRLRIFEAIRSTNGCAIKDLADALGSSTTALYYHLDLLLRAGMISSTVAEVDESAAARGGRRPAVFAARGERIVVEYDPASGRDRRRISAISRAWVDESQNEAPFAMNTAWEALTDAEAAEVRVAMERVGAVLAQARARRDRAANGVLRANHHVAFAVLPTQDHVLPSPVIETRAVTALEPVAP